MATEKVIQLVEEVKGLSVLEILDLVKMLEDEFGVSAAAPMMMGGGGGGSAPVAEEKTEFDVILTDAGASKMNVIKAVKDITGLSLKEAKELVDGAPKPVKTGISRADADSIVAKLAEAGAKTEVK